MLPPSPQWRPFSEGATIGKIGSEGGTIVRDEALTDGVRITLERIENKRLFRSPVVKFAITCGIYGWMVHTRFFETESDATAQYEAMKASLVEIIAALPFDNDPALEEKVNDVAPLLTDFVERYP